MYGNLGDSCEIQNMKKIHAKILWNLLVQNMKNNVRNSLLIKAVKFYYFTVRRNIEITLRGLLSFAPDEFCE